MFLSFSSSLSSSLVGSDRVGSEKKLERAAEGRCSSSVFCLFEAAALPYVDGVSFMTGTGALGSRDRLISRVRDNLPVPIR